MAEKKRILVACGTAIATSTVVAKKLEEELTKRGISVVISQCKAAEVPAKAEGHHLIVTTTFVSDTKDVPVVHSVSFLTGINMQEDIDTIVGYLQK